MFKLAFVPFDKIAIFTMIFATAMQAYGLESDPEDDAEINEEVFKWSADFQVGAEKKKVFFGCERYYFIQRSASLSR